MANVGCKQDGVAAEAARGLLWSAFVNAVSLVAPPQLQPSRSPLLLRQNLPGPRMSLCASWNKKPGKTTSLAFVGPL